MSSLTQSLYSRLPIFLQNAALSLYGLKMIWLRYGGDYGKFKNWLQEVEFASGADVRKLQEQRLTAIIEQAFLHSDYYARQAGGLGITAKSVSLQNLDSLPILEKAILKSNPRSFYATNIPVDSTTVINTSGTSGSPLDVLAAKSAIQQNYAFFSRFLEGVGVSPRDRSVTFAGRMIMPTTLNRPPFHRFNAAANTYLFSSYHLSDNHMGSYIRELEKADPVFIDSYPSAIGTIARYINANGIAHSIRPKAIVTSSETLTDQCRAEIESAFQCKVFDQYGCAEMACFIYQCDRGTYHAAPEYGIVEVVDESGRAAPTGVEGDFVMTGFLNPAMPLIRYRIGDRGSLDDRQCECGRNHPIIKTLSGRADDLILTPEGNYVGRMDPLFKGLQGISAAQIIQQKIDLLEVLIVPGASYTAETAAKLTASIATRVGPSMKIVLRQVDDIPRSKNGKLRAVISNLPKASTH